MLYVFSRGNNIKVPTSGKKKQNIKDTPPQPLTSIAFWRALYKGEPLTSTCLYSLAWWGQMPARHAVILEAGPIMTLCESLVRPSPSRHWAHLKAIEVRGQGVWIYLVLLCACHRFLCVFQNCVLRLKFCCLWWAEDDPGGV